MNTIAVKKSCHTGDEMIVPTKTSQKTSDNQYSSLVQKNESLVISTENNKVISRSEQDMDPSRALSLTSTIVSNENQFGSDEKVI